VERWHWSCCYDKSLDEAVAVGGVDGGDGPRLKVTRSSLERLGRRHRKL